MDIDEYAKQHGTFLKAEDVIKNPNALWEITGEGDLVTSEKFKVERLHLPVKLGDDEKIFELFKEERGEHFDPRLVDIFFEHLDEFLSIRDTFRDTDTSVH